MRRPDATRHNPDPAYLRELVKNSGLTREEFCARLGISDRTLRYYLSGGHEIPYTVQYAAECMNHNTKGKK